MKNRYGDEYRFEQINENEYKIVGQLNYWRFGGKEGEEGVDLDDLGMADPSGGPYIALGMKVEGRSIKRIRAVNDDSAYEVHLEVE